MRSLVTWQMGRWRHFATRASTRVGAPRARWTQRGSAPLRVALYSAGPAAMTSSSRAAAACWVDAPADLTAQLTVRGPRGRQRARGRLCRDKALLVSAEPSRASDSSLRLGNDVLGRGGANERPCRSRDHGHARDARRVRWLARHGRPRRRKARGCASVLASFWRHCNSLRRSRFAPFASPSSTLTFCAGGMLSVLRPSPRHGLTLTIECSHYAGLFFCCASQLPFAREWTPTR